LLAPALLVPLPFAVFVADALVDAPLALAADAFDPVFAALDAPADGVFAAEFLAALDALLPVIEPLLAGASVLLSAIPPAIT
jgi:hypothetical protein